MAQPRQAVGKVRSSGTGQYVFRKKDSVFRPSGQRYINGLASDDALFRYLMDNAISYKDSLNLQLGVSLTAEQVAALTHDIVWMEEAEVNGEKVLTPVLYLAQANNRLAPNGALIQGQDVSLISGGDLHNSGTLRATNNLSMVAGNIDNSGLMQAGNRLEMLATDSIRNSRGGIITGRDISATAVTGDIINERTVTTFKRDGEKFQLRDDVVSDASRFEATDTLRLNAGRDVLNVGSNLKAGGNASVTAGRDVVIASQTEEDSAAYQRRRVKSTEQTLLQHGSSVEVGGNLAIDARRDIAVVASTVSAAKDLSVKAGENLTLAAAANEQHDYSKGKKGDTKTTTQLDSVTQQSAELKAGGDLIAVAGTDLTLVASKVSAGNEAYVHADNELQLLAAQDSNYSLYDMSKKGGWGSKKTQRDEVTDVKNIGSEIKTGGDLTLESGGNQKYQAAKLDSGGDIAIVSGGAVTFEAVKDLHQESHEKSKSDLAWTSAKGKGNTDELLRQTEIVAQGKFAIQAADGLKIDIKHIDQQSVSQTIDVMVKADPQLAWLKEAEKRGDVDWIKVQEMHDSFKYSHSSLGQGAMLAIIIVVTALTAGAASGALGAAAGAGAGSGTAMAAAGSSAMVTAGTAVGTAAAGWGNVMITTALSSMAGTAAASTINNKGNMGLVLKDVTSQDALKGYATGAAIAGFGAAFTDGWGRELTSEGNYKTVSYAERVKAYTANTALKGVLSGKDKSSWLTIAGTGALTEIYQYSAGRGPDTRPGVDRVKGPEYEVLPDGFVPREVYNGVDRDGKNIGLNLTEGCGIFSICHGTPISNGLNQVPGFNSFATSHDTWMSDLETYKGDEMSFIENIGSMPPALFVNYGAIYDKYRPQIEAEKKRAQN
ncbi:Putative large exoprotein, ShlA/HecA/FhaA family [Pseudomonas sp. R2-60-08W]|nr:Putative large exoprotein, ShlA/HecA/FhaA family [Pseudomonas sp. R2-60-08W]